MNKNTQCHGTFSKKNNKKNSSYANKEESKSLDINVVLIGAGIMSATLGIYLKILEPNWIIHMYERLDHVAGESTYGWNNAGTGHSAFCELNYTPLNTMDEVDVSKAISVSESFNISLQLWSYLISKGILENPKTFINNMPHMSFVWGQENISFLYKRFMELQKNTLFQGMLFSQENQKIYDWAPLIMEGRSSNQRVAATRMDMGTDINFGEITNQMVNYLMSSENFSLFLRHEVSDIKHDALDNHWVVNISDLNNKKYMKKVFCKYIFIGGGGASLDLLQKSKIKEANDYAGFPVGGEFLVSYNPMIIKNHNVKVYGKAAIGSPPMSVPHLDKRILDNKQVLLFGPFATFSSKYLKHGSWLDMLSSFTQKNVLSMLYVGYYNMNLVKYLIGQLLLSNKGRINSLKEYYPLAQLKDWNVIKAGQRVQIIKKEKKGKSILKFGTEVVTSSDRSLAALLGGSPGASTSAAIVLNILSLMFPNKIKTDAWKKTLNDMIISYDRKINGNIKLTKEVRKYIAEKLDLLYIDI